MGRLSSASLSDHGTRRPSRLGAAVAIAGLALALGGFVPLPFAPASVAPASVAAAELDAPAPAPGNEIGCCCVATESGKMMCSEQTQAQCLASQPRTPLYIELHGWDDAAKTSTAQEHAHIHTGWHAGRCGS